MSEKPKNKPSNFKKWGIGIILLVLFVLGGLGVIIFGLSVSIAAVGTYFETAPMYELEGQEAREFIEGRFFTLPENANEIHLYYFSIQDYQAFVRFSAPAEAVEQWLATIDKCFDPLSKTGQLFNSKGEILSWWQPSGIYPSREIERCEIAENLSFREIAIEQRDSELWIVYLYLYNI